MSAKRTEHSEPSRRHRSLRSRSINFVGPWLLAYATPTPGLVAHLLLVHDDPAMLALIAVAQFALAELLAWLAWAVGMRAKRDVLVCAHVAATVAAAGVALTLTTIFGMPVWLLVVCALFATAFAASWSLRRIDALRSETRDKDGEDDSVGKALGLAKTKAGRPTVHRSRVEVPLHHRGGETVADAQSALPKAEAMAGILPGRSRVVGDPDDASRSTMVLVTHDALKTWVMWPGPSHPGGSFADPTHEGVYEDGEVAKYWQVAAPAAPGRDSRPASGVGRQGMTRSGKTGNALVSLVDGVLTRRDVVLFYADCTKGGQSIGPLRSGVTLYADTQPKVVSLFRGVEKMVLDRASRLGNAGYRDWSPACFTDPDLRMPAVVLHMDEADDFINTERFTKLCKAGLSTGVYVSVTLPRADHVSIPTGARSAIGIWLCFGVKDDGNTAGFALSEETMAAGAHPEKWGATKQGYHYLDQAPGVDPTRWSVPARSYAAEFDQLAAAVDGGAAYRASLPVYDIASLGIAWQACRSDLPGHAQIPAIVDANSAVPDGAASDEEDEEMPPMPLPDTDDPAEAAQDVALYAQLDPGTPIPDPEPGDGVDFGGDLPEAPSNGAANQAFDDLLRRMALVEQRTEVTVAELVDRFPYRSRQTIARRLTAMCDPDNPEIVAPPGIGLERTDRSTRFLLHVLAGAGAAAGNGNGG